MTRHPPDVLAGQDLVVVDVEGNGQQPPEIVEIAALPLNADGAVIAADLRTWLIKPRLPITPVVTRKVHGIRDRDVADSPAWRPPLVLDTLRLAKHVWPGLDGGYGLDRLIQRADLPGPPSEIDHGGAGTRRHRAGYDTWMTAGLLLALVEQAGLDWDGLVTAAGLPEPQATAELKEEGLW